MKQLFLLFFCLLFICACGTKRQYFSPEQNDGKLDYNGKLKAKITDWNLFSAKLANNTSIIKNQGEISFKLPKDYILLAFQEGEFIAADNNGNLKIFNENNEELYTDKFEASVLSVALNGDDLALILANNSIVLANRSLGIKFSQTLSPSPAQDSRVAAPIFLEKLIIYPSLDGKILVLKKDNYELTKDIVVSAEPFFNNIIHLSLIEDKIIAATAKKIVVITPNENLSLEADIKDIALTENEIFIFVKDGSIIKTDLKLKKLVQKKFDFAIFTKVSIYGDFIYAIEKTGYLLKGDLNLQNFKVFKLQGPIETMSFMDNGKFYYSNKILNLQ